MTSTCERYLIGDSGAPGIASALIGDYPRSESVAGPGPTATSSSLVGPPSKAVRPAEVKLDHGTARQAARAVVREHRLQEAGFVDRQARRQAQARAELDARADV